MAGAVEYDELTIKISASTNDAHKDIKKVARGLKALNDEAKELDTDRVGEVQKLLQDIANIDFTNVVNGLQSVVSAFKAFSSKSFMKATSNGSALSGAYPTSESNISPALKPLDFSSLENTSLVSDDFKELKDTFYELSTNVIPQFNTRVEELGNAMQEMGLNGKQMQAVLNAINYETDKFTPENIEELRNVMLSLGYSADDVEKYIKQLKVEIEKLDKTSNKTSKNGLSKILFAFKNILKYRVIRRVIQEIFKALEEGIKNVASYDTNLQDSLSKLTSAFTYLKNSIGAMINPIIQMVEPALSGLMIMVGDLANTFAEFGAVMNGQDTYTKATYDLKKYNEEAKKTQALGIDELNVISQNDNAGGFATEQVSLGAKENELALKLKETFEKIKKVVEPIINAVKDLVNKVLPVLDDLLTPILDILGDVFEIVGVLVDETFGEVNDSLISFAELLGTILGVVASIANDLTPSIKQVAMQIGSVLDIINSLLGGSFDWVNNTLQLLEPIIHALNVVILPILNVILSIVTTIFSIVEGIVKSLVDVVTFNWGDLGNVWGEVGKQIEEAWKSMGQGNGQIYGYASGGFPENGVFFANDNELVGRFDNGRTAVANNEQITEGIYRAVLQAMNESGGGGVSIEIDGQELAKIIKNKQDNLGSSYIAGGNLEWGK